MTAPLTTSVKATGRRGSRVISNSLLSTISLLRFLELQQFYLLIDQNVF
jgi:hypothetical protein